MNRAHLGCAVLLLALCPRPARAEVVTLPALEAQALKSRPTLDAGAARARAAEADVDKAGSARYPTLALQAGSSLAPGRTLVKIQDVETGEQFLVPAARQLDQSGAFKPQFRNEVGVELKGNLYDFGRSRAAIEASRAQHESAQAEEEALRMAIVRGVRGTYLAWLGASELHTIAEQAAKDAQGRREHVEALIGEGVRPNADLSPARADEMLAKLELERARGDLRAAVLDLEQAVGSPLPQGAEPDRSLLQGDVAPAPSDDDPALHALELQQHAATAAARAEENAVNPLLTGSAAAGVRTQALTVFPVYSLGIGFSLPLWDGGAASANASAARAHAAELSARVRERQQERNGEAARARIDADSAGSRLQTASALLEIAQQRMHEAEQAYELGAAGLDQLAQARSLLRRAQTETVLARIARAEAGLRLASR
jgi:multidrug efflux system outer membrane protein